MKFSVPASASKFENFTQKMEICEGGPIFSDPHETYRHIAKFDGFHFKLLYFKFQSFPTISYVPARTPFFAKMAKNCYDVIWISAA